jgi:ADP-ribose pyrophosphatase YjhB (NUDIX family)
VGVAGPVAAVIVPVAYRGKVLLARRANQPDAGLWGFPGGRIEHGEPVVQAALRELAEETGIAGGVIEVLSPLDALDRDEGGALRHHFVLIPVLCRWLSGVPRAGSDATELGWFAPENIDGLKQAVSLDVARIARRAVSRAA